MVGDWAYYSILIDLPKYMNDVLHVSIKDNGMLTSLPWAMFMLVSVSSGFLSDRLIASGRLSITNTRKLLVTICEYCIYFRGVLNDRWFRSLSIIQWVCVYIDLSHLYTKCSLYNWRCVHHCCRVRWMRHYTGRCIFHVCRRRTGYAIGQHLSEFDGFVSELCGHADGGHWCFCMLYGRYRAGCHQPSNAKCEYLTVRWVNETRASQHGECPKG